MKTGDRYLHFKGNIYTILKWGRPLWEITMEETVTYCNSKGEEFCRTINNFTEEVIKPEFNYTGPRFILIKDEED